MVSDEKSAANCIDDHVHMMHVCCSHCFQDLSFVFGHFLLTRHKPLEFILPGIHWASWMYILVLSIKSGKSLAIIYSNIFSTPFSWFSSGTTIMFLCFMMFLELLRLWSLFKIYFSFCSSDWIISTDLYSSLLILSTACLIPVLSPPEFREFLI